MELSGCSVMESHVRLIGDGVDMSGCSVMESHVRLLGDGVPCQAAR